MNIDSAVPIFESLASPVRLAIYRLLVKAGPDGLVAGRIAAELALPANNASFHLKALTQAGLLAVSQEGRYLRYRASLATMTGLIDFLTAECCSGLPAACGIDSLQPDCKPAAAHQPD